jgi:SAM-dependent methyltransferase
VGDAIMVCPWCSSGTISHDLTYLEAGINYWRCSACAVRFGDDQHNHLDYKQYDYTGNGRPTRPQGPGESLESGYDRTAQAGYLLARYEEALDLASACPATLLDVGCGPGDFLAAVRKGGRSTKLMGVDPSTTNVTEGAKVNGIEIQQAFWDDELTGSYDAITMFGNLMLHKNPRTSIRLAYQRLDPGGILVADIKNPFSITRSLLRRLKFLLPNNSAMRGAYKQAFHGMPWGIPEDLFTKTLREVGFEVLNVRQLPGRNAALSQSKSAAMRVSETLDRIFGGEPWIQCISRKPFES